MSMIKTFDELLALPLGEMIWMSNKDGSSEKVTIGRANRLNSVRVKTWSGYLITVTREDFRQGTWWFHVNSVEYVEHQIARLEEDREEVCNEIKAIDAELNLWRARLDSNPPNPAKPLLDAPNTSLGAILKDLNTD